MAGQGAGMGSGEADLSVVLVIGTARSVTSATSPAETPATSATLPNSFRQYSDLLLDAANPVSLGRETFYAFDHL